MKKSMKLGTKVSCIAAITLVIVFIVLITLSVYSSSKAVITSINSEFSGIAYQNALIVQNILDNVSTTAQNLQDYMVTNWTQNDKAIKQKSVVYDTELSLSSWQAEHYFLNYAWSLVKNNDDIVGAGIFYEPYTFDPAVKDYALYVSTEDALHRVGRAYNKYEEYSIQDYYQKPMNTLIPYFSKPYEENGTKIITVSHPIIINQNFYGIVTVDINIERFSRIKSTDERYPSMYVDIMTDDSTIIYDSESLDYIGTKLKDLLPEKDFQMISEHEQLGKSFVVHTKKDTGATVARYYEPITAGDKIWWATSALDESELTKSAVSLAILMIIMSIIALAAIIIVLTFILKKFLSPIHDVVNAAAAIADGNLNISIQAKTQDEIGILALTFQKMTENLQFIIQSITNLLNEFANGNFSVSLPNENQYIGDFNAIYNSLCRISVHLNKTLLDMNTSTEQVAGSAEQVALGAESLSYGAAKQASAIEKLSNTINEISGQIQESAKTAEIANEQVSTVGKEMQISNYKMQEMNSAMLQISESSGEIGKIIKAIEDIAFQTNILALNATVEAARAGQAGKGFAIVADEVRNLANKASEASRNTSKLIQNSIQSVENGIKIANDTTNSILTSVEGVNKTVEMIQKISGAAISQANVISQITLEIDQISSVVQTNSATSEESAVASKELSNQAQRMKSLVEQFKLKENN